MNTTIEALQAWNDHPPELPMRIHCPVDGCPTTLRVGPWKAGTSLRQRVRSTVRSHILRHYELGVRARSLLLDEAVEGL